MHAPRPTILIVDDDPDHALMLQLSLDSLGFAAAIATTFEEAQAACKADPHDVLVADLALGQRSGADLVRALGAARPPVTVMVTGYDLADVPHDDARCFDAHFLKPINPTDLAGALRSRLRERASVVRAIPRDAADRRGVA
jgi:DNA-binding response OmpR family regulator